MNFISLKKIKIEHDNNYQFICGSNILFSKTNYKNINILKIESNKYRSVGIDIEPINRKMSLKVQSYICKNDDIEKNPLKCWVIKEAVYKAVYSINNKVILEDIKIASLNEATFKNLNINYTIKIINIKNKPYYFSEAIIK